MYKQLGNFDVECGRSRCFGLGIMFHCEWGCWDFVVEFLYVWLYFGYGGAVQKKTSTVKYDDGPEPELDTEPGSE